MNRYIENFHRCKDAGITMSAVAVGYPEILKEADYYKEFFLKQGIEFEFDHFHGEYDGKQYPEAYTEKELELIGFKNESVHYPFGKLCNAGYNVAEVDKDGEIHTCLQLREYLGNVYREIKLKSNIIRCPVKFCRCPYYSFDPKLYAKSLASQTTVSKKYILPVIRGIGGKFSERPLDNRT